MLFGTVPGGAIAIVIAYVFQHARLVSVIPMMLAGLLSCRIPRLMFRSD
jgi:hypothetical protein